MKTAIGKLPAVPVFMDLVKKEEGNLSQLKSEIRAKGFTVPEKSWEKVCAFGKAHPDAIIQLLEYRDELVLQFSDVKNHKQEKLSFWSK